MRWVGRCVVVVMVAAGGLVTAAGSPVSAAPNALSHTAVGGFSTPNGDGFAVVFADGSVRPGLSGDAFSLPLNAAMTGGAGSPTGGGYWEVGADGGVFTYGSARFYGSMGNARLNQPVFSMAPTKTGLGYWLVARDGGIFSFGDARFLGSAGNLVLNQPIVGVTTSATGRGYRMVGRDGGIFDYGDATFLGSLPGRGLNVADVIGIAPTPTGKGYWIARSNGSVFAFGDARIFANTVLPPASATCDPVAAIIANPVTQGYRLIMASGATVAFGNAPDGIAPTGVVRQCGQVTARIELPATTIVSGTTMTGDLITDNETSAPFRLPGTGPSDCQPKWAVTIANAKLPNPPNFTADCVPRPLVIPVGEFQIPFTTFARTWSGNTPLPPGQYEARFVLLGSGFPPVTSVPIRVLAPTVTRTP